MTKQLRIGAIYMSVLLVFCTAGCTGHTGIQQPALSPTPYLHLSPGPEQTTPPLLCRVDCLEYLNLRQAPSPEAPAIGKAVKGAQVEVLDFVERFAHIRMEDGQEGYVLAGYLAPMAPDDMLAGRNIVQPVYAYTHAQMLEDLQALCARYPQLQVESAGTSRQNRDIPVAIVGDQSAPCHILVQASIHGREHMTSLLVMAQLERLLQGQPLEGVCFHLFPMANPDGVHISQQGWGEGLQQAIFLLDQAHGYVQPEEEDFYYVQWKANAYGVDLNRNFDAGWERVNTRPEASSEGWRGEATQSEPETQALVEYTRRYPFCATISYHAMGSEIFAQFGPNSPTNEASGQLGQQVSALTGYSLEPDSGTSFGGYKDWAISVCGIPSLTIEIGTRSCPLPLREFDTIWLRNRELLPTVAQWALSTTEQGKTFYQSVP